MVKYSTYRIQGQEIKISFYVNQRAKSLILRFDPVRDIFRLTIPSGFSQKKKDKFIQKNQDWILSYVKKASPTQPFQENTEIFILGKSYKIINKSADYPSGAELRENALILYGPKESVNERVINFLKYYAKKEYEQYCLNFAKKLNVKVVRVTIKDTKSRWGSCSKKGFISLSWRLLLAPKSVAAYVCAHEVSHLKEMNHSSSFWSIVASLDPHYKKSETWLKNYGKTLFFYGKS